MSRDPSAAGQQLGQRAGVPREDLVELEDLIARDRRGLLLPTLVEGRLVRRRVGGLHLGLEDDLEQVLVVAGGAGDPDQRPVALLGQDVDPALELQSGSK